MAEAGNEVVAAGRLRARALGAEAVVRQRLDALVDAALDSFVTQLKVLQVGLELLDHVIISPIDQILQLQVIELAGVIVLAASPAEVLSPLQESNSVSFFALPNIILENEFADFGFGLRHLD